MNWIVKFFSSSIGRKLVMGATGLFLCIFLLGHLAGNLQLLSPNSKDAFNEYAKFMTTNPAVKVLSYLTYFSILLHTIMAVVLTRTNKASRPTNYAYNKPETNSKWASRSMGLLGTITLIFIITHMQGFWYKMHFGAIPSYVTAAGETVKDLHSVVIAYFSTGVTGIIAVVGYAIAMVALGFHLNHGFASGFQTFGLNHKKYTPAITAAGKAFSVGVPLLFAIIPIVILILN